LNDKDSALRVQPGTATPGPPPVPLRRRRRLPREVYIQGVLAGDRKVLARAITLIESTRDDDSALAREILEVCLPRTGNSVRVGITGVPGAGKSSLIETLGLHLIRDYGEKVAVLAVDPSSQISGGSILGDKTRMEALSSAENAFIRPSPSSGSLGGVARRTRETMLLCEAAGYRNIIVETVGVGQSETAVRSMVDFFLLLTLTGAGDELQAMKRGVMEMADVVAINKADGGNRQRAEMARTELEYALHLFPASPTGWAPRSVTCSAQTGAGIPELWRLVLDHRRQLEENGWLQRVRHEQVKTWMYDIIEQELQQRFRQHPQVRERLPKLEAEVVAGKTSSFHAAQVLLELYRSS
jgi:LAO/AO transport system kinase